MKITSVEMYGFNDSIAYCEAQGLANVFQAYANECSGEQIMQIGFNQNSGVVYIALENGISICSSMGDNADYLFTDFDGDEHWFLEYDQAVNYIDSL